MLTIFIGSEIARLKKMTLRRERYHFACIQLIDMIMASINERFKHMFLTIDAFHQESGMFDWLIGSKELDIVSVFAKASSIEKLCNELNKRGLFFEFEIKLKEFWSIRDQTIQPNLKLFCQSCDLVLSRFLTEQRIENTAVEIAIKQYLSLCGHERFEVLVIRLVKKNYACSALLKLVKIEDSVVAASICAESWNKTLISEGQRQLQNLLKSAIDDDVNTISLLLQVIILDSKIEDLENLKTIIVKQIIATLNECQEPKMFNIFITSEATLQKAASLKPELIPSILNRLVMPVKLFVSQYSDSNSKQWVDSTNSLQYSDVVKLLQTLTSISGGVRNTVKTFLEIHRSEENNCLVWRDLERDVLLKKSAEKL